MLLQPSAVFAGRRAEHRDIMYDIERGAVHGDPEEHGAVRSPRGGWVKQSVAVDGYAASLGEGIKEGNNAPI